MQFCFGTFLLSLVIKWYDNVSNWVCGVFSTLFWLHGVRPFRVELGPHLPPSPVYRWQSAGGIFQISVSPNYFPVHQLHYGGIRPLRNSLFLVFIICTYLVIFAFHTATIWFHATFCYLPLSHAGHLMKISSDFGITFSLDSLTLTVVACLSSCLPAHPQHWNSGCRRTCSSWASCLHSQVSYSTKVLFLSFPSPLRPLTDFSLSFSTFPSWDSYSPFSRPIPVFTHVSPLKFCVPEINHWKRIFAPHCVLHLGPNFVPATWP